jgi:aldehyde:ferredoxin oxidoreductase
MPPTTELSAPRLLEVDLDRWGGAVEPAPGAVQRRPWASNDPLLAALGACRGSALAAARLLAAPADDPPFVVSVGEAVARGLPTAARATVSARAPLTGRLAEGQVGSDLARRLAVIADALVVRGRAPGVGNALVIEADGSARLLGLPELAGADPDATEALLADRLGSCAVLRVGPAGERGVLFANLAAGARPASFVGRGGLGAALARHGLKALCVRAEAPNEVAHRELLRALGDSPRLAARGAGGTLELAAALAARGDLRGPGYGAPAEAAVLAGFERAAEGGARHGCRGCPTPCGWTFERPGGGAQGGRFSALYALGANLGLARLEDAQALLAACNRAGVDAKEVGAGLALLARAGELAFGDRAGFEACLDELARGAGRGARLARGAAALARELGLPAPSAGGEASRPTNDLAALLGQCVGARGAEPLRTFPFLVGDGAPRARVAALVAPLPLPERAEDARAPAGKGRLVWWHENLIAALDASGFCAFSAAGLLADGVLDLERLAQLVAPAGLDAFGSGPRAEAFLALGATLVLAVHALHERWGVGVDPPPEWARAALAEPGMLDEYRRLRGLDDAGRVRAETRAARGTRALVRVDLPAERAPRPRAAAGRATPGRVVLAAGGPLGRLLGRERTITLPLPAPLLAVLEAAARAHADAADWLVRDGEPLPAAWRAGERVGPRELVRDGDRLELVLAVSGG